jgi:hypothetical protein
VELKEKIAYYLTLKMEATCSSETSIGCQRTTQCFIPRDGFFKKNGSLESVLKVLFELVSKFVLTLPHNRTQI